MRLDVGGPVYHVLNRASARASLFDGPADDQQFEQVLAAAQPSENVELI